MEASLVRTGDLRFGGDQSVNFETERYGNQLRALQNIGRTAIGAPGRATDGIQQLED